MGRLRVLSGREVCRILQQHGFIEVRRRGSHIVMQRRTDAGSVTVPIPDHREQNFNHRVGITLSFISRPHRTSSRPSAIRSASSRCRPSSSGCPSAAGVLIDAKLINFECALADLKLARDELTAIRKSWRKRPSASAAVCPHIERMNEPHKEEPMKVVLCTECENCPEVELTPTGVMIGEDGNLAVLTHKEWNLLVDLIQSGELKKVPV